MRRVPFGVSSYAELIADWPVVVLGVCTVLIVVCALVGILVPDLPDFSNPLRVSADPNPHPHWPSRHMKVTGMDIKRVCAYLQIHVRKNKKKQQPSCPPLLISTHAFLVIRPLVVAFFPSKRVLSLGEQPLVSDWSHGTTW